MKTEITKLSHIKSSPSTVASLYELAIGNCHEKNVSKKKYILIFPDKLPAI